VIILCPPPHGQVQRATCLANCPRISNTTNSYENLNGAFNVFKAMPKESPNAFTGRYGCIKKPWDVSTFKEILYNRRHYGSPCTCSCRRITVSAEELRRVFSNFLSFVCHWIQWRRSSWTARTEGRVYTSNQIRLWQASQLSLCQPRYKKMYRNWDRILIKDGDNELHLNYFKEQRYIW
jgi:hypothetical protein